MMAEQRLPWNIALLAGSISEAWREESVLLLAAGEALPSNAVLTPPLRTLRPLEEHLDLRIALTGAPEAGDRREMICRLSFPRWLPAGAVLRFAVHVTQDLQLVFTPCEQSPLTEPEMFPLMPAGPAIAAAPARDPVALLLALLEAPSAACIDAVRKLSSEQLTQLGRVLRAAADRQEARIEELSAEVTQALTDAVFEVDRLDVLRARGDAFTRRLEIARRTNADVRRLTEDIETLRQRVELSERQINELDQERATLVVRDEENRRRQEQIAEKVRRYQETVEEQMRELNTLQNRLDNLLEISQILGDGYEDIPDRLLEPDGRSLQAELAELRVLLIKGTLAERVDHVVQELHRRMPNRRAETTRGDS